MKRFTLIELLVVIAIIAILAAILLPTLNTVKDKAREKSAGADINLLEVAAENYKLDFRVYPTDTGTNPSWNTTADEFWDQNEDKDDTASNIWGSQDGAESNLTLVNLLTSSIGGGYLEVKKSRIPQAATITDLGGSSNGTQGRMFQDPWGQPYMYNLGGSGVGWEPSDDSGSDQNGDGKIDIVSIGSDGEDGGGDTNAPEFDGDAFQSSTSGGFKDNINNWND